MSELSERLKADEDDHNRRLRQDLIRRTELEMARAKRVVSFAGAELDVILAALRASPAPDGWRMVPVEPTEEMNNAGRGGLYVTARRVDDMYRAMIAAAPSPPICKEHLQVEDGWRPIETAPRGVVVEVRGAWKLAGDGVEFTHWRPLHDSDCAVNNAPAMPPGKCDCGAEMGAGSPSTPKHTPRLAGYEADEDASSPPSAPSEEEIALAIMGARADFLATGRNREGDSWYGDAARAVLALLSRGGGNG